MLEIHVLMYYENESANIVGGKRARVRALSYAYSRLATCL